MNQKGTKQILILKFNTNALMCVYFNPFNLNNVVILFQMLSKVILFAIAFCIVSASTNIYEKYPEIQFLNKGNFNKVNQGTWLVEFYAHWCGHCKAFVKNYIKIAKELKGVVNIGAINAAIHKTNIPIRTVPQIKLFVNGKRIDYDGAKTVKDVVSFVRKHLGVKK